MIGVGTAALSRAAARQRRHDDAIGQRERAHLDRVEQRRHKHVLGQRQGIRR